MFFVLLLGLAIAEEEKDFWDEIQDDDVIVEDTSKAKLFAKARFYLPIKRRLKLYPEVQKTVKQLDGVVDIEFVYDAKKPSLAILDSEDITVETLDIQKSTRDEIYSFLSSRGFDLDKRRKSASYDDL